MSNRVWVVYWKEIREIFRDGRSRFNLIISPLIITPLLLTLVFSMAKQQTKKAISEVITVGIVVGKNADGARQAIDPGKNIVFTPVTREEAEQKIKDRTLRAAVLIPDDADEQLRLMHPVKLTLLQDEGSESSQTAVERVKEVITTSGQRITAERLHDNGLSMEIASPFDTVKEPIKGGGNVSLLLISTFLPYMLAVYAIMGGVSPANDSVAGEKERGTLETLLISAASRRDLVMGKFFSIASASLISSILSVIGLFIGLAMVLPRLDGASNIKFTIGPETMLVIFLVQIPLAVLGAGLLLTISTFARNQKEAQTFLAPVLVCVTVAAMSSMFLKADSGIGYALVPILNAALVLKSSLDGSFLPLFIAVACIASLCYAAIALIVAVRMFEKESVLLKA
jgi:sodium transport system permease protein